MVIHTMTSSMADRNIWEVAVYRTIFNILVCIWLVLLSSIISQCMDYGSNRADLLHFWVCGALYKMHSFVKGITLKRKLCQSLRMPQILNSVCSLITSQTPSEYIHKNYDLTRMIFDYQHTKWLSSEIQPSHTSLRKLCKQDGHQIILLVHEYLCFKKNVISYKMFFWGPGSHSGTMKIAISGVVKLCQLADRYSCFREYVLPPSSR